MPMLCCVSQTLRLVSNFASRFLKRNNLGVRRDEGENILMMCKGAMEKGNEGYVPRREGAAELK